MRYLVAGVFLLVSMPLGAARDNARPGGVSEVCFEPREMADVRARYDQAVRDANRLIEKNNRLIEQADLMKKEIERLRSTLST